MFSGVLLAFLWGAVVAPSLSLLIEQALFSLVSPSSSVFLALLQVIGLASIEEMAKALGLFLFVLLLRDELGSVAHGILLVL